ncbi:hypothetical protein BJ170DRAFT_685643 [Xylariales sp. AK1849]|nr:hypothetical protein BJ170DRAFT_685643 [Xylariales sp. AK1849]
MSCVSESSLGLRDPSIPVFISYGKASWDLYANAIFAGGDVDFHLDNYSNLQNLLSSVSKRSSREDAVPCGILRAGRGTLPKRDSPPPTPSQAACVGCPADTNRKPRESTSSLYDKSLYFNPPLIELPGLGVNGVRLSAELGSIGQLKEVIVAVIIDYLHESLREYQNTKEPSSSFNACHAGEADSNQQNSPRPSKTPSGVASKTRPSKRPRINPAGKTDDSDSEEELAPSNNKSSYEPGDTSDRIFACPFFKSDPVTYRSCSTSILKDIRRVKQHLWRSHTLPLYCPICQVTFTQEANRDRHIIERVCSTRPPRQFAGITIQQRERLSRRSNPCDTKETQWFKMWDIVFPGVPRPRSPYVGNETMEILDSFGEMVTSRLCSAINETFPAEAATEINSLTQSVIEECTNVAIERWLAAFSASNQPRRDEATRNGLQDFLSDTGILRPRNRTADGRNQSANGRHPLPGPHGQTDSEFQDVMMTEYSNVNDPQREDATPKSRNDEASRNSTEHARFSFNRVLTASPGPLETEHDDEIDRPEPQRSSANMTVTPGKSHPPTVQRNAEASSYLSVRSAPELDDDRSRFTRPRTRSPERHVCGFCNRDYGRRDNLQKHIRNKHGGMGGQGTKRRYTASTLDQDSKERGKEVPTEEV